MVRTTSVPSVRKLGLQSPTTFSVVGIGAGFVVLFLAWNGAARKDFIQGQFPYLLSGGLVGIALIACGLTAIVVQSHRRDTQALLDKLEELADRLGESPAEVAEMSPRAARARRAAS